MLRKAGIVAAAIALQGGALAQQPAAEQVEIGEVVQGYAYYNRPNATAAEHNADLGACLSDTFSGAVDRSARRSPAPARIGEYSTVTVDIGLMWSGPIQGLAATGPESCMIAKGWRVFRLSREEGEAVTALSDAAFIEQVGRWLGSPTPPGVMARRFENEAAHPSHYHTASRPRPASRSHVSLGFFARSGASISIPEFDQTAEWRRTSAKFLRLPLRQPAPPGKAIVLVRVRGSLGMQFEQTSNHTDRESFAVEGGQTARLIAIEASPGSWRIARTRTVNHCLGSPVFDVAPGEVVYAGSFDLLGDNLGPDMDMDAVRGELTTAEISGARPAVYRNGSTASCRAPYARYPLEIPGAPFEPGYRWGSAAVVSD